MTAPDTGQPIITRPKQDPLAYFTLLPAETITDIHDGYAKSTLRAYAAAFLKFRNWLGDGDIDDNTIADYIRSLRFAGLSPASAHQFLASMRFLAKNQPTATTFDIGPAARAALRAFRVEFAKKPRPPPVSGIDWRQSELCAALCANDQTASGYRDAAIIRVMSDALLRVSEASALNFEDIEHNSEGGAVTIRTSKTDPFGNTTKLYLGRSTIEPLQRYIAMTSDDRGPLFRHILKSGKITANNMSSRAIRAVLTKRFSLVSTARVSGHSLRIGSAQSLAAAGAGLVDMQVAGRWKSPTMPAHYAGGQLAARGAVARFRYGKSNG